MKSVKWFTYQRQNFGYTNWNFGGVSHNSLRHYLLADAGQHGLMHPAGLAVNVVKSRQLQLADGLDDGYPAWIFASRCLEPAAVRAVPT
jgi:hypothetical protein